MSEEKQKQLESYIEKLETLIQKKLSEQHETAPQTNERLCAIERCIFGDEKTGEKGQHEMIKFLYDKRHEQENDHIMVVEMYEFFKGANFSRKILLWIFAALGIISSGVIGSIELFKRLK